MVFGSAFDNAPHRLDFILDLPGCGDLLSREEHVSCRLLGTTDADCTPDDIQNMIPTGPWYYNDPYGE